MESNGGRCGANAWLLAITVAATMAGTGLLAGALLSRHWERVSWHPPAVAAAVANTTKEGFVAVAEWYLDGLVCRVTLHRPRTGRPGSRLAVLFLVPMHAGIWTLCPSITEEDSRLLSTVGFPEVPCTNYLSTNNIRTDESSSDWQYRMRNLSMSCALVCLIIVASSALVGAFGIIKHQISAVLVTGVMYLLAGTFAMFTLMMVHLKRERASAGGDCRRGGRMPDGMVALQAEYATSWPPGLVQSRRVTPAWSLDLGWAAAAVTAVASALWILLAKVMRYNPLHFTD